MPYDLIVKIALGIVALGLVWAALAWAVRALKKAGVTEQKLDSLENLQEDKVDGMEKLRRERRRLRDLLGL